MTLTYQVIPINVLMRITMVTDIRTLKTGGLPPSLSCRRRLIRLEVGSREHRMWNGGLASVFEGLHPPEPDIFLGCGRGVCPSMTEGSLLQGVTEKQLPNQWLLNSPRLILKSFTWRSTRYWVHRENMFKQGIFSSNSNEVNPDSISSHYHLFLYLTAPPSLLSFLMSSLPYSCHFSSNVSIMLRHTTKK